VVCAYFEQGAPMASITGLSRNTVPLRRGCILRCCCTGSVPRCLGVTDICSSCASPHGDSIVSAWNRTRSRGFIQNGGGEGFSCPRGNSVPDRQLPANDTYGVEKRKPIRVFSSGQGRLVHQSANSRNAPARAIEFLPHQFWVFTPQYVFASGG